MTYFSDFPFQESGSFWAAACCGMVEWCWTRCHLARPGLSWSFESWHRKIPFDCYICFHQRGCGTASSVGKGFHKMKTKEKNRNTYCWLKWFIQSYPHHQFLGVFFWTGTLEFLNQYRRQEISSAISDLLGPQKSYWIKYSDFLSIFWNISPWINQIPCSFSNDEMLNENFMALWQQRFTEMYIRLPTLANMYARLYTELFDFNLKWPCFTVKHSELIYAST